MVSALVPTTDGQSPNARTADLFFPETIRPDKTEYRLIVNNRELGFIDLTKATGNEFYYEDLPDEISQRLVATIDNSNKYEGKFPSELLTMPSPIEVHADWGAGFQRVFLGQISTEINEDRTFQIIANDPLWRMLRSDATVVIAPTNDASYGLDYLAIKFGLPVAIGTLKPHVKIDQFISRGSRVAQIYASLFDAIYGHSGERWMARYNPRAQVVVTTDRTIVGAVEYIQRQQLAPRAFELNETSIFEKPYYKRTIDDLVTVVQLIEPPRSSGSRSDASPDFAPLKEISDPNPSGMRSQFGDFIRIVYLEQRSNLTQVETEAQLILNEFGRPKEERRFEAFDLPWIRRWDRVFTRYAPLGALYTVESVVHDCLSAKMRVEAAPTIEQLLFPKAWMLPDGEVRHIGDPADTGTAGALLWPYPGIPRLSGYDFGDATPGGGTHGGVDIGGSSIHANVFAAGGGKVSHTESGSRGQGDNPDSTGYGNWVEITHGLNASGQEITTRYAHLNTLNVTNGQNVNSGQLIGQQGNTGTTRGDNGGYHLHFEVRVDGAVSNPNIWCEVWQPA